MLEWASSLITTLMGGAPNKPRRSTSQSLALSMADRAAASATKFAIVTPVTNPTDAPRATGSISVSHRSQTDSIAALTGLVTNNPAFWSHAVDSQLAARAGTWDPPITNPKYRPPAFAMVAGDPYRLRKSIVSRASLPASGSSSLNAWRPSIEAREGLAVRSLMSVK